MLGAEQSVELFYADEIAKAEDKQAFRAETVRRYREKYENPIVNAANNIYAEDVINPAETRRVLIRTLIFLRTKYREPGSSRSHGKIPL